MRLFLVLLLASCLGASALTPNERVTLQKARAEIVAGQVDYKKATDAVIKADRRAEAAESSAAAVASAAVTLQTQVDKASERETKLVAETNSLRETDKQVRSYWGLGGMLLGFSILVKHFFVLAVVIGVLGIGLYVASFFFPVIGVGFTVALSFVRRIFTKK